MKKLIALMLTLVMCLSMVLISCKDKNPEESSSSGGPEVEVSGLPEENTSGDNVVEF